MNNIPTKLTGRPSLYTPEVVEEICERYAEGETFSAICADPAMPSIATVMKWKREIPAFKQMLMEARESHVQSLLGSMFSITAQVDEDNVQSSRVKIAAIQWLITRMAPKEFSERVIAELAKLPEPKAQRANQVDTEYLTYEERETLAQLLMLAKARKEGSLIEHEATEDDDGEEDEDEDGAEEGTRDGTEP